MRRERKSPIPLGFALVLLLGSLGHAEGLLMKEIGTFGTHRMAIDLGGQSSATVSIVAGDQPGEQLVLGRVTNIWTEDGRPPTRRNYVMTNTLTLRQGEIKRARVDYGTSNSVPVVIRGWASQGNMFNRGLLIITDNWDRNQATFRYELQAWGGLPLWQFLLGFALWFTPGGQIGTALLWGSTSNSGSTTITIDSSKTVYYKYTGCTATGDYDGSFTLYASAPPGQAIVLNAQGWCGWGGFGNWARVSQAVTVPSDFHQYSTTGLEYTFGALGRTLKYVLGKAAYVGGPDDCGNYYMDRYPHYTSGGGINFVISGADCDSNMWGAPNKPGRSYTSMPSLTLTVEAFPGYLANQFGSSLGTQPSVPYRYSLSWTRRQFTYRPSAYIPGYAYTTWVSSQLPDGTTVSRKVPQFSIYGSMDKMAIISLSQTIGVNAPDLIIPSRSSKCTFKNDTNNQRLTVYLLDPPGTYSPSSLYGGAVPAQTSELAPNTSASYPPGFYLVVKSSTTNFVAPNAGQGLTVQGCSATSTFYTRDSDGTVTDTSDISPMFFAY